MRPATSIPRAQTSAESPPPLGRLSPAALVNLYAAAFRTEIALQLAYRGAIMIWLFSLIVQPLVSLVVWTTVAESQGGSAGGYTTGEYSAYFIALMVVNQLTFMWHMWEFEWRVRTGFYSPILLRPVHPIHTDVSANLAFKTLTLIPLIPVAIFLSLLFDATFETSLLDAVAFIPALVLAMALRYIAEWTFGMIAFWITKTAALNQLYSSVMIFLAGGVAPLTLFPEPVRIAASILPFRWMVSFPVEVVLGQLSGSEILLGLGVQVAWIGVILVTLRLLWHRAIRRYSAVGA